MRHPPARRQLALPVAGTPPLPSLNAVAATGLGITYNTQRAFSNWEVQISTTASPTFSVQLQGSLDGQSLVNIGSPITTTGLTNVTSNTPLTMVALNLTALSGGTLTGTIAGTESPAGAGGGGGGGAVAGDVASGTADSGNPVKIGEVAVAHGANPTAVAAGARTNLYANRAGVPFVIGGHPNTQTIRVNYTAAQTDTAIITIATGLKIVVTGFLVTADAACTVNTTVRLGFGAVNTPTAAGVIGSHPGVAPGSGFGRGGGAGIIGVGADDADLRITSSVPTGGSIDVDVSYYTIES